MPENYPSQEEKIHRKSGALNYLNKGWRINTRNWEKRFEIPSRGMIKLQTTIGDMKLQVSWMKIVFDPEWKGRFDTCVDGSPIMFVAEVTRKDGSNGYIDLQPKNRGSNFRMYQAKEAYCRRNNIPFLVIHEHLRTDEMAYLIDRFLKGE